MLNIGSWKKHKNFDLDYYPGNFHIIIDEKYAVSIGKLDENYDICLIRNFRKKSLSDYFKVGHYKIPKDIIPKLESFEKTFTKK